MRSGLTQGTAMLMVGWIMGCGSSDAGGSESSGLGGNAGLSGGLTAANGGSPGLGGAGSPGNGGTPGVGGRPNGGMPGIGGATPNGGAPGAGGRQNGGAPGVGGGLLVNGGAPAVGGGLLVNGGAPGFGGEQAAGMPGAGGEQAAGMPGVGGEQAAGMPGAGGEQTAGAQGDGGSQPTGGAGVAGTTGEMPNVYDEEDTGADCPEPAMPSFAELEEISYLPDPFMKADGTPITTKAEWRCRRAEIKAILEHWDVGEKPGKPSTFEASLEGNTLHITVGENGQTFEMTAAIERPQGAPEGPIPAIIGINTPTGSLPAELFSSRGIATITYDSAQLAPSSFTGGGARTDGNFYSIYPGATAGFMIRWAWGISRIIDALQELPEANIDVTHLAVSGCSFQGKIALYAGAFDERIRLTIPHESGGGGTISWRYSDMLEDRDQTEVENLHHALGAPWYAEAVAQFANNPNKLPFDHHELIGMIAPRAVLAIESSQIARMGAEAARIDALGAREIWTALGVPYRMGATEENTGHCSWHQGFTPDLEAYLDAFMLDDESVDTDILRSKFTNVDAATWIPWETPALQ